MADEGVAYQSKSSIPTHLLCHYAKAEYLLMHLA